MDKTNSKDNILIAVFSGLLLILLSIIISLGFQNLELRKRNIVCPCPMGCPRGNDADDRGTTIPLPLEPPPDLGVSSPDLNKPLPVPSDLPPSRSGYTCPPPGYIDCMPTVGRNYRQYECTNEAIAWYERNCIDFEGVAY